MKYFSALFFLIITVSEINAQAPATTSQWLAPACKPKTFGLHNSKGEIAVEAKFDMLEEADGTGWIAYSGGKYGVINNSGGWIIKPQFEIIVQFLNGKAVAGKKQKTKQEPRNESLGYYEMYALEQPSDSTIYFGVIDASGVWIIDASYSFIRLSNDGSAQYAANGKYGYLNADGSVMIRAQYDFSTRMNEGSAVISEPSESSASNRRLYGTNRSRAGKYSVVDRNGTKLNTETYDLIREYKEGRAAFNKGGIWKVTRYNSDLKLLGGKWGYLDASGKEIIAPVYDYVYDFENGKAKVRSGQRIFWIDKDGKETTPPSSVKKENAFTIYCAPGFFGYVGLDGRYVIQPQYFIAKEFSEGLAAVMPLRVSDMDCGFTPERNSSEYSSSHNSYNGLLKNLVNLDRDYGIDFNDHERNYRDSIHMADSLIALMTSARRLYGYADKTGNMVLPAKYEVALPFHNGCAYVLFREKWGVIDTKGNWVFAPVLEWPGELQIVRYEYGNDGRQYYVYEYNEQDIYAEGNTENIYSFSEGIGCIYKYGKYGFIDTTGRIIASPVYDEAKPFLNGFAAVRHGKYWGFIDRTGKETIPLRYTAAGSFTAEGLACVAASPQKTTNVEVEVGMEYESEEAQYYGYIDKSGNWAIKPKFTGANDFSNGLARVSVNYLKSGYIDKTGKYIIPPKYDYAADFKNGFALVRINMYEAVYIDKTGKISKTFTVDNPPKNKSIPLKPSRGDNNYFGFVNEKEEVVIPFEYAKVGYFTKVK